MGQFSAEKFGPNGSGLSGNQHVFYGPAGLAASLNNGAVASAAVAIPPNLSRLAIGRWQAPPAGLLDGWLRRLRYARSQLTGTALQGA